MNNLRRAVQLIAFAVFLAGTETYWLEYDPLISIVSLVSREFSWGLVLRGLLLASATLLIGRFFCGWLCPLGTFLDAAHRCGVRPSKDATRENGTRARWKFVFLAFLIVAAAFGTTTFVLFDPLVLFSRTREAVLIPAAAWVGTGVVRAVRLVPGQESFAFRAVENPPAYGFLTLTAAVFAGILILEVIERRFWCRNLCPLGAFLNLLSRTGLVRRSVESSCSRCARCERDCPTGAIPMNDFTQTRGGECIQCLRCQRACSKGTVRFVFGGPPQIRGFEPRRRQVLLAAGAGVAAGFLGDASTKASTRPGAHLRPPGAIPEEEFLSRCTRCLICVDACPTHGLQPSGLEIGWEGLWTPKLVPASGGCEEPCNACTQICPTLAIRRLSHEEKSFAKIGTARIVKERCVAWEELKACLVCDEVCPYDAIEFLVVSDHRGTQNRPVVHADKCMGCGLCEHACPVREPRAIVVDNYGEERIGSGSYITPAKQAARKVGDDRATDYFREFRAGAGVPADSVRGAGSTPAAGADTIFEEPLPPGFVNP